ncbi:MAG: calcium/sodium antiporter [Bacteroidales bacterium]|nr:calcium/sodium antiporter [Bacteroidales bacterium]
MVTDLVLLIVGLVLLILGAEWLVDGSSSIARRAGLSEFLIGMAVIGIGTSMPELVVSLTGALKGSADIAIGNVVGSNIFNVFLILGVTALISPVAISSANKKRDIPLNIAACVLLICFGMQYTLFKVGGSDTINALEGGIFLLLFVVYLIFSFRSGKDDAEEEEERGEVEAPKKLWYSIAMVLVGLASLVYGGDLLVDSACNLARDAGLSEKFIAITILAGGTSFPELVTCVVAAAKKKDALALGNIIGSNISNILLILGASALACPLSFANIKPVDLGMLVLSSVILIFSAWSGRNNRIGKGDATLFLIIFASYMTYLIMTI